MTTFKNRPVVGGDNNPEKKGKDHFYSPPWVVDWLLAHLDIPPRFRILETAAGDRHITNAFLKKQYSVESHDITDDPSWDFFEWTKTIPDDAYRNAWEDTNTEIINTIQVTNPPYAHKFRWLSESYRVGIPFALLMPTDMIASKRAQALFKEYGVRVLIPDVRVNFKPPQREWVGSSATFHTSWFIYNGLPDGEIAMEFTSVGDFMQSTEESIERIWEESLGL